jgi:hypothetical protein
MLDVEYTDTRVINVMVAISGRMRENRRILLFESRAGFDHLRQY